MAKKGDAPTQDAAYQQEIARVAYHLFEQRGCRHGQDQADWLEAEQIVLGRRPTTLTAARRSK